MILFPIVTTQRVCTVALLGPTTSAGAEMVAVSLEPKKVAVVAEQSEPVQPLAGAAVARPDCGSRFFSGSTNAAEQRAEASKVHQEKELGSG